MELMTKIYLAVASLTVGFNPDMWADSGFY
jgi:hypothetical protein